MRFVAQFLEVSVYKVFQLAYSDWFDKRMNNRTMDYRFENYLSEDVVPFWVWTFTKGAIQKYEKDEVKQTDYGINHKILTRFPKIVGWLIVLGVGLFSLLFSLLVRTVQL